MGAVTSATFTKPLAIFLPRLWDHELYFQDDWKVTAQPVVEPRRALDVLLAVQDEVRPAIAVRSERDRPGDRTEGRDHASEGRIGKRDLNNFQPRLGLAWNFHPEVGIPIARLA